MQSKTKQVACTELETCAKFKGNMLENHSHILVSNYVIVKIFQCKFVSHRFFTMYLLLWWFCVSFVWRLMGVRWMFLCGFNIDRVTFKRCIVAAFYINFLWSFFHSQQFVASNNIAMQSDFNCGIAFYSSSITILFYYDQIIFIL